MATFLQKISIAIATGFGIGYLIPIGQGSLAALAAIFFVRYFSSFSFLNQTLLILAGILIGIAVSTHAEKVIGKKDDHSIVIDEIVSIFITFLWLSQLSMGALFVGFILNRLLDIWKPLFIRRLQSFPGGWGIMMDDIASAILSGVMLRIILLI